MTTHLKNIANRVKNHASLLRKSIDMLGIWAVFWEEISRLASKIGRLSLANFSFDRKHNVDTSSRVRKKDLGVANEGTVALINEYITAPARVIRFIIRSLGIRYEKFSFIDIGCGKGRPVLVASEFPFRQIFGVEISEKLCEVMNRNILNYRPKEKRKCADISVLFLDARDFSFPQADMLIYMYNPFKQAVLREFLSRLEESLIRNPRHCLIVFLEDRIVREVFNEFPFLRLTKEFSCIQWYYSWYVYENSDR